MVSYGVQTQQLNNLSKKEFLALKDLSYITRNIYNVALYNTRQHFFNNKEFLSYNSNYHLIKDNENYKILNKNAAQLTIKKVQNDFKSFFALLKLKNQGNYNKKIKVPNYLKDDKYYNILFQEFSIKNGIFSVPMSPFIKKLYGKVDIKVPSNLVDHKIKEIRIVPKLNARFFEIQYVYEVQKKENSNLNKNNVLAIDLGINNLCTCTTNKGNAFIIDGKKLKSINQFTNKKIAYLQSIKDKQKITKLTKKQSKLWTKRNNQMNYYLSKVSKIIIDYCLENSIGSIVLGYNENIQNKSNIGKINNQNFVNIPIGKLNKKLKYLCNWNGIDFILQEESYTSKSSFLDNDEIPVYDVTKPSKYVFSGKRVFRGLYKTKEKDLLNADVNGSLNILRKVGKFIIKLESKEYLSPIRVQVV